MRQITIKFSNRTLYTVIALLILATGLFIVNAAVDKSGAWHSANQVEVNAGGLKTLQEAINDGSLGGITSESDPTVIDSVKDGVNWNELSGIPAGFADGFDDVGGIPSGFVPVTTYENKGVFFLNQNFPEKLVYEEPWTSGNEIKYDCYFRIVNGQPQIKAKQVGYRSKYSCDSGWVSGAYASCTTPSGMKWECPLGLNNIKGSLIA